MHMTPRLYFPDTHSEQKVAPIESVYVPGSQLLHASFSPVSACLPGKFKDTWENEVCKNCPVGKYNNVLGEVGCFNCDSGKYKFNWKFKLSSVSCVYIFPAQQLDVHPMSTKIRQFGVSRIGRMLHSQQLSV